MFTPEPSMPGAPNASIPETEAAVIHEPSDTGDFEFVLGRRQIASLSLVGLIVIGTFAAGAYMIGKSTVPVPVVAAAPAQPKQIEIVAPVSTATPTPEPQTELKAPAKVEAADSDTSIFGVPQKNQRYLQLGSVERGFAILMAHGARKEGYHAMVAAGTNPNVYRVLVGPFEGQEEYQAAKTLFTSMGLDPFTRKYDEKAETPEP
jgi:hypothetical protein